MSPFEARRSAMVENQLRPNGVADEAVLRAMRATPREAFLPKAMRAMAYADEDVPLPNGGFLIEPLALGRLLQAAAIEPSDVVVVIDGGVGYSAAVVAQLSATTFHLVADEAEKARSEAALDALDADNAIVVAGSPQMGHRAQAPFDKIVIAGAIEVATPELEAQLAPQGGVLTAIRKDGARGRIERVERCGDACARTSPFDAATPVLAGFAAPAVFSF